VPHPSRRHQVQHPLQQAVAGAQDGYQHQLLAGEHRGVDVGERGCDLFLAERQVAHHLVAEQKRYFAQQLAELRGRGFAPAHQRELVLDQGVVE